jgi:hypothetical protein
LAQGDGCKRAETELCMAELFCQAGSAGLVCGSPRLDCCEGFPVLMPFVAFCRFESQQTYHFYSASLLLMYNSPSKDNSLTDHRAPDRTDTIDEAAKFGNNGSTESETSNQVEVRLIDFAHVIDGKGNIDSNFLSGLQILIERFTELLSEVSNSS